ncbi:modulator protein [Bacillus canaveralius]|uniref:Modulator protein n=1 Tax=Bacillus canaveralius TaxID=1403243 RepID=A0A2N5GN54_9BACI|nr:STAS domain-containing protein [Bacillus canaveralius]PLR83523.1 modulator protein [Bacillus canaveralius]PLS00709.1 modulator protein [Bacillus canaveralius]
MRSAKHLGQLIVGEKLTLSSKISENLNEKYIRFLEETDLDDQQIVQWRAKLIGYTGQALISFEVKVVWDDVNEWARNTGEAAVQYGVEIDELLNTNKIYRKVIWDFIQENIDKEITKIDSILRINQIIDSILDQTAYMFSVTFVEYHRKRLTLAKDAMLDISTPVVSISDEVAILPLVGELDTYRAKVLMESSLQRCASLGNSELIIDLSGVPIVDTMVASELFQVANALRLVGVRPTFTGLRPELAQAVISLGIDFKEIRILGTLKQAMASIQSS